MYVCVSVSVYLCVCLSSLLSNSAFETVSQNLELTHFARLAGLASQPLRSSCLCLSRGGIDYRIDSSCLAFTRLLGIELRSWCLHSFSTLGPSPLSSREAQLGWGGGTHCFGGGIPFLFPVVLSRNSSIFFSRSKTCGCDGTHLSSQFRETDHLSLLPRTHVVEGAKPSPKINHCPPHVCHGTPAPLPERFLNCNLKCKIKPSSIKGDWGFVGL